MHVVEQHVVCIRRGLFQHVVELCDHVVDACSSMSWRFSSMSCQCLIEIVCRGEHHVVGSMSWVHVVDYIQHVVEGCRGHIVFHDMGLVCRGENPPCNHCPHDMLVLCPRHGGCRGGTSWTHLVFPMYSKFLYLRSFFNMMYNICGEDDMRD